MTTTLLLGTHNNAKIARYQKFLMTPNLELIVIKDLPNYDKIPNILESGNSELENAQIKAKAYYDFFKIPTISEDSGFYIEGLEDNMQPRKDVKGIAGVTDELDSQTTFDLMTNYYINVADQFGGQVPAYFLDTYSIYDGVNFYNATAKRHLTLTNQINGVDLGFPISSLYLVNQKPYHSLSDLEMGIMLKPSLDAMNKTIKDFLSDYKKL